MATATFKQIFVLYLYYTLANEKTVLPLDMVVFHGFYEK